MLCQNCGKYEATTHIKRVINGEAGESHLCSKCAAQLGCDDFFGDFGLGIPELFTSFFGDNLLSSSVGKTQRCPGCGCSFEDIIKTGRVGCADCYEKFYDKLLPSVQRIHGRARHSGKVPNLARMSKKETEDETKAEKTAEKKTETKEASVSDEIAALEEKMAKAVSEQNFELAAQLRDEIKKRKGGSSK